MSSPARRLVEARLATLSDELEALVAESRQSVRREYAEQLNQAARRLRAAGDAEELCATLENAAAQFAGGAMVFRAEDGVARHARIKISLSDAAAFAAASESREPQTAAATAGEVSSELVELLGHAAADRASVFPVEAGERVAALLYAWGEVQVAAIELLTQMAGALFPKPAPPPLVTIAPAPVAPKGTWEDMPPEEQQIHLRAQRFARVQVAEMRLYEAGAVQSGRTRRDLYNALRQPIDKARDAFREQFFSRCASMVDYLHLELTRTLANDDPDLLGKDYPGPLV